ncbi:MAG: type IV pilin protein [Telluria sp.]
MTNTKRSMTAFRRHKGFTLIEIMITVAIVSVLAAVAIPAYSRHTLKANRSNAQAILMETAQFMERYYSANNTYVDAAVVSAVVPKGATGTNIKYNVSFSVTPTASAYTVRAVPANGQASDSCGTLTLAHTGAQTPTTGRCW